MSTTTFTALALLTQCVRRIPGFVAEEQTSQVDLIFPCWGRLDGPSHWCTRLKIGFFSAYFDQNATLSITPTNPKSLPPDLIDQPVSKNGATAF